MRNCPEELDKVSSIVRSTYSRRMHGGGQLRTRGDVYSMRRASRKTMSHWQLERDEMMRKWECA